MFIKITPFDTLFFRTGRPFSGGVDTWVDAVFPPFPSTLYGAIRSFLIFHMGTIEEFKKGKFKEIIGTPSEKGSLVLKGPFLYKKDDVFLKPPLDIVYVSDEENLQPLKLLEKPDLFVSDYGPENILIWPEENAAEEAEGVIDLVEFMSYLENKQDEYGFLGRSKKTSGDEVNREIYAQEQKVGIARDVLTGTSKENYLYRIPLVRLQKDVSLLINVGGVDGLPSRGVIQLGGESKAAEFERINGNPIEELMNIKLTFSNGLFKLYLATPAIFENGWLPKWINKETFEGEFEGIKLKLVACAIGRSVSIGGWDMAKNKPKPMRKAVPAGSVYYFRLENEDYTEKIRESFHFKNISDVLPEEGFGLAVLGEVKL